MLQSIKVHHLSDWVRPPSQPPPTHTRAHVPPPRAALPCLRRPAAPPTPPHAEQACPIFGELLRQTPHHHHHHQPPPLSRPAPSFSSCCARRWSWWRDVTARPTPAAPPASSTPAAPSTTQVGWGVGGGLCTQQPSRVRLCASGRFFQLSHCIGFCQPAAHQCFFASAPLPLLLPPQCCTSGRRPSCWGPSWMLSSRRSRRSGINRGGDRGSRLRVRLCRSSSRLGSCDSDGDYTARCGESFQ